jgi:tetratricopeptide (TPR) repeat protein
VTSADSRAARISQIFGLLDDGPAGDHDRRIGLCREALALMTPEEAASPAGGWLQFVAGKALVRRAGPDRVADLTAAIDSFQAALATWTPEDQPANWTAAQTNLSVAYSDRHALTGSLDDEQGALAALDVALRLIDPQRDPVLWAQLANNLGVVYLQRTSGDRAETLEEAISCLEAAAQLRERHGARAEWARTQANLGVAYRERVDGDRSANLERSLACLSAALKSLGDDHNPVERARILLQRAETLRYRVAGTWAANADLAYADARRASELVTPALDTVTWAEAQAELGATLRRRTAGSRTENLEEAIACYRRALGCYDPAASPLRWALVGTGLGSTLVERTRGQRVTNVEEALEHLTGAAAVLRDLPAAAAPHAAVLAQLGSVYLRRRRGDAAANAEAAWRYLSEARDLEERLSMPRRTRAAVLNYLGNASMARERGDRGQHVEDAIACYELGRELAGPEDGQLQARLLSNLAAAYAQRPRGDRAGNIARSLELYERLSSFRTREMSPLEWAEARSNTASVLASSVLPGWLPAAPAPPDPGDLDALGQPGDETRLDEAAEAFREALSVLTESGPAASVITAGLNLGYLGTLARRWRDAVDGYQAALDAFGARYRESLQPEARYDELTDVAGLPAELAAALASQARDAAAADAAGTLLRRAAATLENGRMQLIGDLMERDQAVLVGLRSVRPQLYEAYRAASQRLREQDAAEWAQFQLR